MIIHYFTFGVSITIVIGDSTELSTSNIREIAVVKKNCSENGSHTDMFR
jgi:hypothetical protein